MDKPEQDEIVSGVQRQQRRWRLWEKTGAPSLGGQLARVGVLGWIIVVPTLLGAWLGRLLDQTLGSGILFSGALLTAGLTLGCWSAWKWMHAP